MTKVLTVIIGAMLAITATTSMAQSIDLSQTTIGGNIGASSRSDYRGQEYSTGANIDLGLRVSNIGVQGTYVSGDFSSLHNTFPLHSKNYQIQSDLGVGYVFSPVKDLTLDVNVTHIYNAQEFMVIRDGKLVAGNYSEFRVGAAYKILYANIGQAFGRDKNTYLNVGVNVPVSDKLHVGAGVSAFHYQLNRYAGSSTRYNNAEVFTSYQLLKNVSAYGKYSFGGKNEANAVITNYGIVGVNITF